MSNYKIRPHHGLCTYFFKGDGYSDAFVENMTLVLAKLKGNPIVTLVSDEDVICAACPNNDHHTCTSIEKVSRYDTGVLTALGLSFGDNIPFQDFQMKIKQEIIEQDKLSTICGDCEWFPICK